MKGSIRFILGLVILMGVVGADINAPIVTLIVFAFIGCIIMLSGALALGRGENDRI